MQKLETTPVNSKGKELAEQLDTGQGDARIRRLAEDFYQAVCSSERFSWMGLFETTDELKRPRLVLYLKEKSRSSTENPGHHRAGDIVETFSKLWFSLQHMVYLDLYYNLSADDEQLVERCIEDIKLRYGTDNHKPEVEYLWSDNLHESM